MIKMEPPVSQIDRVRRALSPDFAMSNNSTPATDQMKKSTSVSEEEWKTPRKEGYPDQSPRSSARKWLKSEEALLTNFAKKAANNPGSFSEKIEIGERCKGVHCVDLGESFPTSIYLQKSASIQPRTSPSKFGGKIQFTIHFTP